MGKKESRAHCSIGEPILTVFFSELLPQWENYSKLSFYFMFCENIHFRDMLQQGLSGIRSASFLLLF